LFYQGQGQQGTVAVNLVWGCGTQGGIKGQVGNFAFLGDAGLDITAAFAFGAGTRTAPGLLAREPV
jgi:hypothetical protein